MNVGASDAVARVQAIQQMATALGGGGGVSVAGAGFSAALQAAETAGGATGTQAVAATQATSVSGTPYATEINAAATKYGIDPALLAGLVKQESGFNPNATSAAGAKGLTQLMPATARSLGVTDPTDPAQALDGGAKYLKQQLDRFGGDERLALAAYNAGPGAVQRFGGVPPYAETKAYVEKVLANRDAFRASGVASTPLPTALPGGVATSATTSPISAGISASSLALDSSSTSTTYGSSSSLNYPTT